MSFYFFFFFQAEDGIRDVAVTGVQTCALPISRTAISCDSHERREQHFRRPAEKSGQVLVRTQKANTPARRGWNADRAQPFLVIAARDASNISDDRQKKPTGFGPHPDSGHPRQKRPECPSRPATSSGCPGRPPPSPEPC